MSKDQKGFSVIEILIVVVILGLIGAAAWLVYDRQKNSASSDSGQSTQQSQTAQQETTKSDQTVDETANWTKVTSGKSSFTIKLPDGWNVKNWASSDYSYAASYADVTYTAGKPATVNSDASPADGGPVRHFNITGSPIAEKDSIGYYFNETPQDFNTTGGAKGKKYVHTYPQDVDGVKKGDKVYLYRFEGKKTLITIEYYVLSGESDQSALVEKAIRTLAFE